MGTNSNIHTWPLIRFLFVGISVSILVAALSYFSSFLNIFFLAIFLAIIFTSIFHWLQQKGLPKALALLIMVINVTLIGIILIAFFFKLLEKPGKPIRLQPWDERPESFAHLCSSRLLPGETH